MHRITMIYQRLAKLFLICSDDAPVWCRPRQWSKPVLLAGNTTKGLRATNRRRENRKGGKPRRRHQQLAHRPYCSFCGKAAAQVSCMVAGPHVFICDECIGVCVAYLLSYRLTSPTASC